LREKGSVDVSSDLWFMQIHRKWLIKQAHAILIQMWKIQEDTYVYEIIKENFRECNFYISCIIQ